ncbi:PIN domain-like protein [Roridomyces roridus]|uniref:PIN domain-like protein n=1 Tax=Roridomyces roridus TaxID=1738132 RepID=A0AAD7FRR9_9AGAR|nr:PIN domain-like protein [Roridomyces roridus]
MGISKLWEVVDDAAEKRSLLNLATNEGFKNDNRGIRGLVIGVDISIRIKAITAALRTAGILNPPPKLILERIFYQLCNFLLAPIIFVFVFDGPGRPSVKRNTRVVFREGDAELIRILKTMILDFGFFYYEATEAELAQLNANDELDAIITEDSDSLVFGAHCVVPRLPHSLPQRHPIHTGRISRPRWLIALRLLLGGDYDDGLPGFGPKIARALAACGFGRELVNILNSFTGVTLAQRLGDWRNELQIELETNRSRQLDSRHPKLAQTMPTTFPNVFVEKLYLHPLTSKSPLFSASAPDVDSWQPKQPNISSLSSFCSEVFGWRGSKLLEKFNAVLWPGAAFKLISSPHVLYYPSQSAFAALYDWGTRAVPRPVTKVVVLKMAKLKHYHPAFPDSPPLNIYRVGVSASNFVLLAGLAAFPAMTPGLISIPEAILAVGMRDLSLQTTGLTLADSDSEEEAGTEDGEDDDILEIYDTDEEDLQKAHSSLKSATAGVVIDLTMD